VRDHEGCTIAAKTMTKLAILESVAAKASVVLYVAEFSQNLGNLGLRSMNMEDDVVQVVNALKAWERNWS
jgi:hypothetical protein